MALWGTAHASATNKPKYLPDNKNSNYDITHCYADQSGWVMRAGSKATGNGNVNAKPETDIIKIRKNLLNQLESPVLWMETINSMVKNDLFNFFEVGPGKILNKLNYQINNNIKTQNIDKMEHLNTYAIL